MAIIYMTGNLYTTQPGHYIAHSVNAQGVMGRGFAKTYRELNPDSFSQYSNYCSKNNKRSLVGTYLKTIDAKTNQLSALLVTSEGYGTRVDAPSFILDATKKSVTLFLRDHCSGTKKQVIESPRINSGLFSVPWEKTEAVLANCLSNYPHVDWIVWGD